MKVKEKYELDFQKGWKEFSWDFLMRKLRDYWKTYRYLEEILSFIRPLDGKRILDVGCGVISVLNVVKVSNAEFYGIDPLMDEYKKLYKLDESVTWSRASGEEIPFNDKYFDVVFCTNIIDHTDDPLKVVEELYRVLKLGAYLVLTVDIFQKEEGRDPAHPHAFTEHYANKILADQGFEIVFDRYSPIRAQVYWFVKNNLLPDAIKERVIVSRKKEDKG
jgi:ubiquinone/menaquinone biosynthesis C-methylase UbiE